jgi:hypothetical protein
VKVKDAIRYLSSMPDDEEIIIAWWEYGDGVSWDEITKEQWDAYCSYVERKHDWSYEHEAIADHFDMCIREEQE